MNAPAVSPAAGKEILFFFCLNDRGGAEISMIKVAQGLAACGRSVTLAVYGTQTGLARELGFNGEVIDLRAHRTANAGFALWRLLCKRRFSVVIAALTHTNIAAIFAACLAGSGARVIATEHGLDGITTCQNSWPFKCLTRFAYTHAASVVAVSKGLAQRWRDILPPRAFVETIYNPVVPDEIQTSAPPAHEWLAQKNIPVIIGMGRLKPEKNFALLIRAFAELAAQRDSRLIILGEGEERPMLENLARELGVSDKILMPGFVGDTGGWLAHAALFASPSQREGFGNAIVEVLACGVPVVATDCPYGPAEILDNGKYGRLVPVGDIPAMARALAAALDSAPDKELLRARAAHFGVARCIDLYDALLDNASRS